MEAMKITNATRKDQEDWMGQYDKEFPLLVNVVTEGKYWGDGNMTAEPDLVASAFFVKHRIVPKVGELITVEREDEENGKYNRVFTVVGVEFNAVEGVIDVFLDDSDETESESDEALGAVTLFVGDHLAAINEELDAHIKTETGFSSGDKTLDELSHHRLGFIKGKQEILARLESILLAGKGPVGANELQKRDEYQSPAGRYIIEERESKEVVEYAVYLCVGFKVELHWVNSFISEIDGDSYQIRPEDEESVSQFWKWHQSTNLQYFKHWTEAAVLFVLAFMNWKRDTKLDSGPIM
jgi:hypothetical protein